jgi:hypothetical protein
MRERLAPFVRSGWVALRRERLLALTGLAGIAAGGICAVGVAVHGPILPPEGKLLDAATFNLGVGIFLLTIALVLPLAGFSPPRARIMRALFVVFAAYSYPLETIQAFRGMDPRFSPLHGPVEAGLGQLFGATAALLTFSFIALAVRFFRSDVLSDRPVLRLGLRYGSVAVVVSFAVGIVMSVNTGRIVGEAGDLIPAHGLGVHGIQTIPVVALLLAWGAAARPRAWTHVAGIGWLVAVAAAAAQALGGRPLLEPGVLPGVAALGLMAWAGGFGRGLLASLQESPHRGDHPEPDPPTWTHRSAKQ